jgi:hypothetical protein
MGIVAALVAVLVVVGVVLLGTGPDRWHLKLLATSCRVVAVGAGTVLLTWLVDQAAGAGVHLVLPPAYHALTGADPTPLDPSSAYTGWRAP